MILNKVSQAWVSIPPNKATADDVVRCINAIAEWRWESGYSFAHIAIADYNINNCSIDFCLRNDRVEKCVNERIEDRYSGVVPDYNALEVWERGWYDDEIELRDTTISLLNWLKLTPETIRDDATDMLWGRDGDDVPSRQGPCLVKIVINKGVCTPHKSADFTRVFLVGAQHGKT